jgi:hypothetical protein
MGKIFSILIFASSYASLAFSTPMTEQEKLDFIRGHFPSCIAKNNANKELTSDQKVGIENYCSCSGSVMASLITREELQEVAKGILPTTMLPKAREAQQACIEALSQ